MTPELRFQTPEGVTFSYVLAGPISRCLAWAIDAAAVVAISSTLSVLLRFAGLISPDFAQALLVIAYFTVSIGYGIALEWSWHGQTLGKRLLQLRVTDERGLKLQFSQVVVRNLLRAADMLPAFYLVGGLACLLNKRAQRLGDLAANTVVVRHPKLPEPDLDQLATGKFNSLRAHPHLAARLRQLTTPTEATLAMQAVLRRDELDPAARVMLFSDLAGHLRSRVQFPPEAVEAISDEQFVRNAVEVLFQTEKA